MLWAGCFVLFTGCASGPKPVYQRGWIGGDYHEANTTFFKKVSYNYFQKGTGVIPALPASVPNNQTGAIFVSRIYKNTPLSASDIREGDIILSINDKPITTIKEFHTAVDTSQPGDALTVTILRDDTIRQASVIVGKETYQNSYSFMLGLRLASEFNIIPHPDFNILGLLSYEKNRTRLELNSPEYRFYETAAIHDSDENSLNEKALANWEGWDAWCLIFGFGGKKIICEQTSVLPQEKL